MPILQVAELPGVLPFDVELRKKAIEIAWPSWQKALLAKNIVIFGAGPVREDSRLPISSFIFSIHLDYIFTGWKK